MRTAKAGVFAFLYVLSCFALLALFPLLMTAGFALWGPGGAVAGFLSALFILAWAACWFLAAA